MSIIKNNLLIIGAGGHGKVIADIALAQRKWDRISFLDDNFPNIKNISNWEVIGKTSDRLSQKENFPNIFIAIGNNKTRKKIQENCRLEGFYLPTIIHPNSNINSNVQFGDGCAVMAGVTINIDSKIGLGVIVNTNSSIDHDCIIGAYSHICPGVNLAGNITVGGQTWVGIGSNIIQNIHIGQNVMIGAGSTVIKDIESNVLAFGNPCTIKKLGLSQITHKMCYRGQYEKEQIKSVQTGSFDRAFCCW